MDNEILKDIKDEITAIRRVVYSDGGSIRADDHIALDLRLQHISHALINVKSSLDVLTILLVIVIVVMLFK